MTYVDKRIAIIDADFIPYKAASVQLYNNLTEENTLGIVDSVMKNILIYSKCTHYVAFVSGKSSDFRKNTYADYKQNRSTMQKPPMHGLCVNYLINKYDAFVINYVEVDDICSTYHYKYSDLFTTTIMCSPDKDLLQCPGEHYNIKEKKLFHVNEIGEIVLTQKGKTKKVYSTGQYKLWHQMISGDPTDNIKGIPGKGDVAAYQYLSKAETVADMEKIVTQMYLDYYGQDNYEYELEKNYCLVKMRNDLIVPDISKLIKPYEF